MPRSNGLVRTPYKATNLDTIRLIGSFLAVSNVPQPGDCILGDTLLFSAPNAVGIPSRTPIPSFSSSKATLTAHSAFIVPLWNEWRGRYSLTFVIFLCCANEERERATIFYRHERQAFPPCMFLASVLWLEIPSNFGKLVSFRSPHPAKLGQMRIVTAEVESI